MLHISEITGSDKPIYEVKEIGMFTYDELVHLNENPTEYQVAGFIQANESSDELYEKLYTK